MAHVRVTRHVSSPLDVVWERIGHFDDPSWLPGVTLAAMDGTTRVLKVPPSQQIRETLLEEGEHSLSWATEETPLPIRDYVVTLTAASADGGTEVTWDATFTATQQVEAQAEAMMRDMITDMLAGIAPS